jgi:biotin carboxylase
MSLPDQRPILLVGFSFAWLNYIGAQKADVHALVIEEPDVARKRDAHARLAARGLADRLIEWEYQLPGAAMRFHQAHADLRPAAVLPCVEYAVPFAARLAELYGVAGAGSIAAATLRDKWLLRHATARGGVTNPRSEQAGSALDVHRFMLQQGGAVVLKPANRQGSIGTRVLFDPAEVGAAWDECIMQDEGVNVPDREIPLRMLVEQYISGDEFSVEMLVRDGVPLFSNVTQKRLFPGPRPIEMGHAVPAGISDAQRDLLIASTRRVLSAVNFRSGFVHCEWIISNRVPVLVECAGRMPGDGIVDLIDYAWGTNMTSLFVDLMRGADIAQSLPRAPQAGAAVWFLRAPAGEVRSVTGVEACRAAPGVLSADVLVKPGDRTHDLRSSWDRVGFVRTGGPTAQSALHLASVAASLINVEVEPVDSDVQGDRPASVSSRKDIS